MSHPTAPPPYSDKDPLYPSQPAGYGSPSGYGVPGGYVPPGGFAPPDPYAQPGGYYPQPGGYPEPSSQLNPDGHRNQPPPMPMPIMPRLPLNTGDGDGFGPTDGNVEFGSWDSLAVRHTFIRKVYMIISVQLLVTVAIIAVFTFVEAVGTFVRANPAVYYVSYAVFFVTYIVLACCQGPRRRFPWNIIILSIFTLAMSFMAGTIASYYSSRAVIISMGITVLITIAVTVFCFQTKVDFTSCGGFFAILGIGLMLTGIVTAIVLAFKYIYWLHMLYAGLAAVAFTLFLVYDTQLVLGKGKNSISPEEYIYGAMQIYTDIVQIFLSLLQIVGSRT